MIVELTRGPLTTLFGEWTHVLYWDGNHQAIAMIYGDVDGKESVPCRVHSSCITAHVFASVECDCREQMELSMKFISESGAGVVIWLDHEGRANGMLAHIASQQLKRDGVSQSEAYERLGYQRDARRYQSAAEILRDLRVVSIVVLTNNPKKVDALREAGLPVVRDRAEVSIDAGNIHLAKQYRDKREVDGHLITERPEG